MDVLYGSPFPSFWRSFGGRSVRDFVRSVATLSLSLYRVSEFTVHGSNKSNNPGSSITATHFYKGQIIGEFSCGCVQDHSL